MIFGLGTDIVEIDRIHKVVSKNDKFAMRILTAFELDEYAQVNEKARYLAKRFAAKEALVKAMGTGIGNGIGWQMSQVEHTNMGRPFFNVSGAIKDFFIEHKIARCHVSISDEKHYVVANVIIETNE